MSQSRRQALYFPAEMLAELQGESKRQDRSLSWLIQQAWKLSRKELAKMPSTTDYLPSEDGDDD
ncbi:MAG: TIGR04563 family protein [Myxococcota bacterium]